MFRVQIIGVAFGDVDPFGSDAVAKYEEALVQAQKDGISTKALFLCSPHNPLGVQLSISFLANYLMLFKVDAILEKY